MIETIEFDIYEDAPEIFLEEVVGPCQYDGSNIIILEFENDCVGLTAEAATNLQAGLQCLLSGERIDMAPVDSADAMYAMNQCINDLIRRQSERPAHQRYGRGLIYLGLSVLLGLAWHSFYTFTMR